MILILLSTDADVLGACRELMAEFSETAWQVITSPTPEDIRSADLCLWDFTPGRDIPTHVQWGTRFFVLVRRKDLAGFRTSHPEAAASVILKPITRSVLRSVFSQAIAAKQAQAADMLPTGGPAKLRSDRDALLQSLMEANLRLQEYDQERTNFLARAVHDFRAPLTAISGYCGLLMEEQIGALNEEQREIISRMSHSARRLGRMTNAMFQLSIGRRLELKPTLRSGDIRLCIEHALHEVSQFTAEKGIEVAIDVVPCLGALRFDASQIEQTLMNLLDNACKFTPRFSSIEIRGYPYFWERRLRNVALDQTDNRRERQLWAPNSYRIDIRDAGPGIDPDHLDSIFEEYTVYPATHDRSGGGLGLAICKMIIGQHGGRVWAESTPTGAVFSIVLPFHSIAAQNGDIGQRAHAQTV